MSPWKVLGWGAIVALIIAVLPYATGIDLKEFWPRTILGILGLFCMLIMHVYSIRKRNSNVRFFMPPETPLSAFLNWHIVTGTIGVTIIFFHAIGTYDSTIAWVSFFSMFIVWQSGFVGRYIFVRLPKDRSGLVEEKTQITETLEEKNKALIDLMVENNESDEFRKTMVEYLANYGKSLHLLHKQNDGSLLKFFSNFFQILQAWKFFNKSIDALAKGALTEIDDLNETDRKEYKEHINHYKSNMKSILMMHFQMEFSDVLKALFKNWHDIHIPLTYLLYTTAVLHIIVVSLFAGYAK